jgi:hypothetical protein
MPGLTDKTPPKGAEKEDATLAAEQTWRGDALFPGGESWRGDAPRLRPVADPGP